MNKKKLLQKATTSPSNLHFNEFVALIEAFGFRKDRISGSHQIYERADVGPIVNIQEAKGKAKAYQIRQFLQLVERYNLQLEQEQEKVEEEEAKNEG